MGAIERMADVVRRHCGARDAPGNPLTLADDIRISSLEALLPKDLEKHVQLSRARLTSNVCPESRHQHIRRVQRSRTCTKLEAEGHV